jgi:hypothetical protein
VAAVVKATGYVSGNGTTAAEEHYGSVVALEIFRLAIPRNMNDSVHLHVLRLYIWGAHIVTRFTRMSMPTGMQVSA